MGDVVRADAERAAAQDRLRHAERMESLGQLVGGIAHDFNNLLNVITCYGDLIAEEIAGVAGEDARLASVLDDVDQVRGAAQRAVRLTRQLLIFARSDVVHPEVLSLNEIIAGLQELLRRSLGEHISLTITSADDLWPVKADAGQLEQVLVNLAVNARDAMPGGGKLTIDTANIAVDEAYAVGRPGLKPGRYTRLRVSGTGTGIPPRCLPACSSRSSPPSRRAREPGSVSQLSTASSPEPRPALPVLYMSGYAQPVLDTHGALANQIDLVEKPFTETTLLTRVRRAIDNGAHPATHRW